MIKVEYERQCLYLKTTEQEYLLLDRRLSIIDSFDIIVMEIAK